MLLALRALRCVLQRGCECCVVRGLHRVALRCVRRGASAVRAARWHGAVRAEAQCLRALLIVGNIVCFDGPAAGGRLLFCTASSENLLFHQSDLKKSGFHSLS